MDPETQEPHGFLKRLYQRVKAFEPNHPSHNDLQRLGIQVSQVATANETILFDPCYFRPHLERLLQKYPVDNDPSYKMNGKPLRMNAVPTFDQLLVECQDRFSDPDEAPREAEYLKSFRYDNFWYLQGLMIYKHISWQLFAFRNIRSETRRLLGLGGQEVFSKDTFKPHTIISFVSDTAVNETHQGLTTHELIVIVNMMLIRVNHAPFFKCDIHPVLALSFLGPQKGRIIQAIYDDKSLVLQHSQLWTFKDPLTAPVEMFVR